MTTYNTGNPVPSADARDRYDNSQTLDEVVNGDSASYTTRTGKQVISLGGMNSRFNNAQDARESAFNLSQEENQEAFQSFLDGTGWSSLGAYAAGISIVSHTQTVDYLGQPYQLKPSIPASLTSPYVTTGDWATEGVNFKLVGDNSLRQDLASPIGASMVFNKSDLAEAVGSAIFRSVKGRLADEVSAKDFVIGDGVSDESVAFQALVDRISSTGGGCILMPAGIYQASFIAKPGVTFVGASYGASRGNIGFSAEITRHTTVFKAAPGKTWIIDTPTGGANNFGVLGIDFQGGGLTIPGGGIYMRAGTNNSIVRACSFNNFSEQALVTDGLIGYFESLSGTNCLLSRARTQRSGVFEFGGADNFIVSIQGNTGITTLYSEDLFLCGILVKGANNYGLHLEGELSEVGVYVTSAGAPHKITSSRADLNFGPGFVATAGMFVNCHSLNNSQTEDGKYDGFVFGADVQATGCKAETRGRPNRHGYGCGWQAGADVSSFAAQPLLDCFTSTGHSKGAISDTLFNGFKFVFPKGWCRGTGATPSVESVSTYIPVDTAPVTLTGFNSMVKGQELTVLGNANVTLQRSATFIVNGVNGNGVKKLSTGKVYRFLRGNGITYEIGGDTPAVGTTSERPNTFAQPGLMYLDTTLAANGKPIFRNALNTGWVDSTGASV